MQIELGQIELRYRTLRAGSPARRRSLMAALSEAGQQVPVVVVTAAAPAKYVLIDGYTRVELLRRLGRDTVEATVWPMEQGEALITRFHLEGGARSALEEGWLIEHLATEEALSLEEISTRLCRSKSWVSRRLGLCKVLSPEARAKVAEGQIPPQAAMKYLVPLARANGEQAGTLVAALGRQRLSVRQVARLYNAYRAADAVGRARLVSSPLLFLQMDEQADRHRDGSVDRVVADLGAIAGLCGRVRRRLSTEITAAQMAVAGARVRAGLVAAQGSFSMLVTELRERLDGDRPGAAHGDLRAAGQGARNAGDRQGAEDLAEHRPGDPP